ncbi:hypothetical protein Emed_006727 [Eimeria media]
MADSGGSPLTSEATEGLWRLYTDPFLKGFFDFCAFFLILVCCYGIDSEFLTGSYTAFARSLSPQSIASIEAKGGSPFKKPFFVPFLLLCSLVAVLALHAIELSFRPKLKELLKDAYSNLRQRVSNSSCNIPALEGLLRWLMDNPEAGAVEEARRRAFRHLKALHMHSCNNQQWLFIKGLLGQYLLSSQNSLQRAAFLQLPRSRSMPCMHQEGDLLGNQTQAQRRSTLLARRKGGAEGGGQVEGNTAVCSEPPPRMFAVHSIPTGLDTMAFKECRLPSRKSSFESDELAKLAASEPQEAPEEEATAEPPAFAAAAAAKAAGLHKTPPWWRRLLSSLGLMKRVRTFDEGMRRRQALKRQGRGPIGDTELVWAVNTAAMRAAPTAWDRAFQWVVLWLPELLLICVALPLWSSALSQSPRTDSDKPWAILNVWGCLFLFCFCWTFIWDACRGTVPLTRIARGLVIQKHDSSSPKICCCCREPCVRGDLVLTPPMLDHGGAAAPAPAAAGRAAAAAGPFREPTRTAATRATAAIEPTAAAAEAAALAKPAARAAADAAARGDPAAAATALREAGATAEEAAAAEALGITEAAAAASAAAASPTAAAAASPTTAAAGGGALQPAGCSHTIHLGCFFSQGVPWCRYCGAAYAVAPLPLAFNLITVLFCWCVAFARLPWRLRGARHNVADWWTDLRMRKRAEQEHHRLQARLEESNRQLGPPLSDKDAAAKARDEALQRLRSSGAVASDAAAASPSMSEQQHG